MYERRHQAIWREGGFLPRSTSCVPCSGSDIRYLQECAATSSSRTLVPDVLIEIFMLAVSDRDRRGSHAEWNKMAPNNIAAVCRQWRNLALSHSMLWSTFKYADERFPFPWNQLFLFFFRSGQAPLTLELADLNLGEDHMNVASLLCNHQHRFKHVSIHFLKDEITTGDMNEAIELKNIPLLETLQLNMMCKTSPLRIQLQHAPCLTSLNLVVPYSVDFGDLIVPNLTDCVITQKIEFMTVNDCLTLLRSCPALINFSAETCFRGRQRVDFEDIYNPNLISFRLGCTESSASWSIMQRLRFPNLKRLSLLQNVFRGHVPGASALISRSQSLIESLELMSTSVDCIMQCLELSPNLERLSVSSCYEDGGANVRDVILRLTLESGERVCPRLKTIEFAYFDLSQHTGEIASMVKSRWHIEEGTRHLESVVFRFCKVSAFPDLDHCRDEGLNIDIIAPGYP